MQATKPCDTVDFPVKESRSLPFPSAGLKQTSAGWVPACVTFDFPCLLCLGRLRLVDVTGLTFCVVIRELQGCPLNVELAPARSA